MDAGNAIPRCAGFPGGYGVLGDEGDGVKEVKEVREKR
jgi:hypothetical protein